MNWDVIPDVFYDVIARVIPGSVLVLTATVVYLGPSKVVEMLSDSPKIGAPSILLFLLLAYFVAIVIGPVWKALSCKDASSGDETLFRVRRDFPDAVSKLVKIQAERDLCEVLGVGFSVLWTIDLYLCVFGSSLYREERVFLLGAMTLFILSCGIWWNQLTKLYSDDLDILQDILDEQERKKAEAAVQTKKWWQVWK
jgi:hypothetical protein